MLSDIEIARAANLRPIAEVAARIGIPEDALYPYGRHIAKLETAFLSGLAERPDGKLILVTAISPTPAGEGKTTTTVGLGDALNRIGRKSVICLREPSLGPVLRHEGRRRRRRLRASRADGRDQSPFHRRLPRHHDRQQSPGLDGRQPHVLGQRARDRSAPRRLAPRARPERPRAARDGRRPRRRGQWVSARGRVRHHGRVRNDGGVLPRRRSRRSRGAAGPHDRRLQARQAARDRDRHQGRRGDDRAAQGRASAQSRADARRIARARARRPVRQHRPRLQFRRRDPRRAEARRLCRDRSRIRRRPRRGEILRHQVPHGRAEAGSGGHRRFSAGAQDAWRGRQGRARRGIRFRR